MNRLLVVAVALAASAGAARVRAQAAGPSPSPATETAPQAAIVPEAAPDISIEADVSFGSLRFEQVGRAEVTFGGTRNRTTTFDAPRRGLPTPVQPGVTYRDGGVHLTIRSSFKDVLGTATTTALGADLPATRPSPSPQPQQDQQQPRKEEK
jgi:hypothetical protein